MNQPSSVTIHLPGWLPPFLPAPGRRFESVDERMDLAIRLAAENVERETGGPFGAAIFDMETGTLVSAAVNVVVSAHCSAAHAEMIALMVAQKLWETHDLGGSDGRRAQLVTLGEPCAMCFGALPWSGIRSLVYGARGEDIGAIGFDEGRKVEDWEVALRDRGIDVVRDVAREAARQVLQAYAESDGPIYDGRVSTIGGGSA